MPLQPQEIKPGAIAYFDAHQLNTTPGVRKSGDVVTRPGQGNQFVCYFAGGGESYWAPLTATARRERLRIEAAWVRHGYGPLATGDVYLQDGKNTYAGPDAAFIAAAAAENPFKQHRPSVDAAGLKEIARVIVQRGGLVPGR